MLCFDDASLNGAIWWKYSERGSVFFHVVHTQSCMSHLIWCVMNMISKERESLVWYYNGCLLYICNIYHFYSITWKSLWRIWLNQPFESYNWWWTTIKQSITKLCIIACDKPNPGNPVSTTSFVLPHSAQVNHALPLCNIVSVCHKTTMYFLYHWVQQWSLNMHTITNLIIYVAIHTMETWDEL